MFDTGYNDERAKAHDALVDKVLEKLHAKGFKAEKIPQWRDRPDIEFWLGTGENGYLDIKTIGERNYDIKVGAFHRALACHFPPTYFMADDWTVHTSVSLQPRYLRGPCPPTGKGSKTYFYLFRRGGGIPFDEFFPSRERQPT